MALYWKKMRITFAQGRVDFILTETFTQNASDTSGIFSTPTLHSTCKTNGCLDPHIFFYSYSILYESKNNAMR